MKKLNVKVPLAAAITLAALAAFSNSTCLAQAQIQQPRPVTTTRPIVIGATTATEQAPQVTLDTKVDTLIKRVDALETENKQLKSQLFAAKLLLTGLDKGVGDFKQQFAALNSRFETHTHGLNVGLIQLDIKCEASIGNCTARQRNDALYLFANSSNDLTTSAPRKP